MVDQLDCFGMLLAISGSMAKQLSYTVYFTYDVNDHSLKFPLRAEVEAIASGVYHITDIRQEGHGEGSLLPPIRLRKENGVWLFVDTETASRLSAAIGEAIDSYENGGADATV
jgi:hypothetical protein